MSIILHHLYQPPTDYRKAEEASRVAEAVSELLTNLVPFLILYNLLSFHVSERETADLQAHLTSLTEEMKAQAEEVCEASLPLNCSCTSGSAKRNSFRPQMVVADSTQVQCEQGPGQ